MLNKLIRILGVVICGVVSSTAVAEDSSVIVTVDRAKIFRVESGASAVVVGNPFIADVAMFDENTVVITGKSYGTTNLVILDQDSKPIVDEVITVRAAEEDVIAVYRNKSRSSLSCSPICEPTLRLGDDQDSFSSVAEQATSRNQLATEAANGG